MTAPANIALVCAAAAAAAGATALGLLGLLRWAPRLGLIDQPNARSSHRSPRPRGGGAAIAAGQLAAVATLTALGAELSVRAAVVLGGAMVLAVMGLWDDRVSLRPQLRLAGQVAVAAALVAALGGLSHLPLPAPANLELPRALGAALAVLWLVATTNFVNFMDGIDGLAGGQALLTVLAFAWLDAGSESGNLARALATALLVFLAFNWPPARLFLGDAGSGYLGFLLAAWPWLRPAEARAPSLLLVATSLALFLLDPVWTLAGRFRRGARLAESHRDHLYQRLVDGAGERARPHAPVTATLLAGAALLTAVALWSYGQAARGWWSLAVVAALFFLELVLSRWRGRRRPVH